MDYNYTCWVSLFAKWASSFLEVAFLPPLMNFVSTLPHRVHYELIFQLSMSSVVVEQLTSSHALLLA